MRLNRRLCKLVLAGLVAAGAAFAQTPGSHPPGIQNGDVQAVVPSAGLATTMDELVRRTDDAVWIGYATARVDGSGSMCCYGHGESCCGVCSLEGDRHVHAGRTASGPVRLEPASEIYVLMRADQRRIVKVRAFSADCALDAGGRKVHWLGSVDPDAGVKYLSRLVTNDGVGNESEASRVAEQAVAAVAQHRGASAVVALDRFAREGRPLDVRKKAVFWLGAARGQDGFEALRDLMRTQKQPELRKKMVFAISVSPAPQATDELIRLARRDESPTVRKAALFWLSKKAGEKAAATITDAVEDDPDTDVKKKAVFALSQLPADEGVPLLIQIARSNSNPEVRKKAAFWLGQKDADAAVDFFEEILK